MAGGTDRQALAVVEAAYRIVDDRTVWLEGVVSAAQPLLDRGLGVFGFTYRIDERGRLGATSRTVETPNLPPHAATRGVATALSVPATLACRVFAGAAAIASARTLLLRHADAAPREYRPLASMTDSGFRDCLGVTAYDPSDIGLLLAAPMASDAEVTRAETERWKRLRAHMLAGLRLQRALEDDAVIDPSGRVVHARGSARAKRTLDVLRTHARLVDRARSTRGGADPRAALAAWTALVDGRWSLVDRFEADGRRYFVARRNDPDVAAPRPLSLRERQVLAYAALGWSNKDIAYGLGLRASTVSSHLRNAMRRVGARDLTAVAAVWSSLRPGDRSA